jgi:hypothetical protein
MLRLPATTKMSARTDTSTTTAMGWGVSKVVISVPIL